MNDAQTYLDPTLDKLAWGPGPWLDEPDKTVWVDDSTDLDCMMRRGGGGAWCGYVGVPETHPMFGLGEEDCDLDVHGCISFTGSCDDEGPVESAICHVPLPGRPAKVWWFGFDCGHHRDARPADRRFDDIAYSVMNQEAVYRDASYVESEVERLARQLAAA